MHIPLWLHLFIHFISAVLAGYLVGRYFNKIRLGVIAGILGGFLIDLDHFLEYFFVFGSNFNFNYFITGRAFLVSNKISLIFHAWEYIPILLIIAWFFRRHKNIYIFLIAFTWGGAIHLSLDCFLNSYPVRNYSIIYRTTQSFNASQLLSPAQLEENAELREELGL